MGVRGGRTPATETLMVNLVVFSLNKKDMWCLFLGGEAAQKQTPQPSFHC
jgi:hypothetical protein